VDPIHEAPHIPLEEIQTFIVLATQNRSHFYPL